MSIQLASAFVAFAGTGPGGARALFARAFGLAVAAIFLLVCAGAVRTLPAMAGLMLFAGFLVVLHRQLAGHHPFPRLGAANRITLIRAGSACLIACRAFDPAPLQCDRALGASRPRGYRSTVGRRRWLGRPSSRIGLGLWCALRYGDRRVCDSRPRRRRSRRRLRSQPGCWRSAGCAISTLLRGACCRSCVSRCRACVFADWRRKSIAVVQSLALLAALVPATPAGWAAAGCALALGLLVYSFAADVAMQLAARAHR